MVQLDRRLTEEELALLGHSELVAEEGPDTEPYDDSYPAPAGFRERLILGDLSW
jgi:hypothetical protein